MREGKGGRSQLFLHLYFSKSLGVREGGKGGLFRVDCFSKSQEFSRPELPGLK